MIETPEEDPQTDSITSSTEDNGGLVNIEDKMGTNTDNEDMADIGVIFGDPVSSPIEEESQITDIGEMFGDRLTVSSPIVEESQIIDDPFDPLTMTSPSQEDNDDDGINLMG